MILREGTSVPRRPGWRCRQRFDQLHGAAIHRIRLGEEVVARDLLDRTHARRPVSNEAAADASSGEGLGARALRRPLSAERGRAQVPYIGFLARSPAP